MPDESATRLERRALGDVRRDANAPRHVRVSGPRLTFAYERCEDEGCVVVASGVGSSCGRLACPSCGSGGSNLTVGEPGTGLSAVEVYCTCGNVWVTTSWSSPGTQFADHAGR